MYSPSQWAALSETHIAVDDRCVNFGGKRNDGSFCKGKAEASGWCAECWAELAPEP